MLMIEERTRRSSEGRQSNWRDKESVGLYAGLSFITKAKRFCLNDT